MRASLSFIFFFFFFFFFFFYLVFVFFSFFSCSYNHALLVWAIHYLTDRFAPTAGAVAPLDLNAFIAVVRLPLPDAETAPNAVTATAAGTVASDVVTTAGTVVEAAAAPDVVTAAGMTAVHETTAALALNETTAAAAVVVAPNETTTTAVVAPNASGQSVAHRAIGGSKRAGALMADWLARVLFVSPSLYFGI